jgi:hypothetical protein
MSMRLLRWGLLTCYRLSVMCCEPNETWQIASITKQKDVKRIPGVTDGQGSKNVLGNKVPWLRFGEGGSCQWDGVDILSGK